MAKVWNGEGLERQAAASGSDGSDEVASSVHKGDSVERWSSPAAPRQCAEGRLLEGRGRC